MDIAKQLVKDFVDVTGESERVNTAVYGTLVEKNGVICVRIDGSSEITPITSSLVKLPDTVDEDDDTQRVTLEVKNHQVVVTGNLKNKAIGTVEENGLRSDIQQTNAQIKLTVEKEVTTQFAALNLTSEGILAMVQGEVDTQFTNMGLTAESISEQVGREVDSNFAALGITSGGITALVQSQVNTQFASIGLTSSDYTTLLKNQEDFTTFQQTVEGFSFMGKNGTVKISGGDINLTGSITFSDLNSDVKEAVQGTNRQFSSDLTNWHDTMQTDDIYRRDWDYTNKAWGSPYQFKGKDGTNATVPTYITDTIIDQYSIQAKEILANDFAIYPSNKDDSDGGFNIYGNYKTIDTTTYEEIVEQFHFFQIEYKYQVDNPTVTLSSPAGAFVHIGDKTSGNYFYMHGTFDFSDTTTSVIGVTATFA